MHHSSFQIIHIVNKRSAFPGFLVKQTDKQIRLPPMGIIEDNTEPPKEQVSVHALISAPHQTSLFF